MNPLDHLRYRYGRRAVGLVPDPDCVLCQRFVADLPVPWLPEWLGAIRDARSMMGQSLDVAPGKGRPSFLERWYGTFR